MRCSSWGQKVITSIIFNDLSIIQYLLNDKKIAIHPFVLKGEKKIFKFF
jgi:hypothetical protein